MRYLCVHCDTTFDHDDDAKKPRCPSCMRVNGLEKVAAAAEAGESSKPAAFWPVALVGGLLVAAGIGYAFWVQDAPVTVGDEVPLRALSRGETIGHLRQKQVDDESMLGLLLPSDATEAFAETASGGANGADAAEPIVEWVRERSAQAAFVPWSFGVPREIPFRLPEDVAEALEEDGARLELYPLEVAALVTNALRSRGATAMVAEAFSFPGDRSPPDPSGHFGYYVVAVHPEGGVTDSAAVYYDPYGGREVAPDQVVELTDIEAIGGALGLRALRLLSREGEPNRALDQSSSALSLYPRSPTLRLVRAAVLLAGGQPEAGLRELQAAMEIRPDPPRRNQVAAALFAQEDLDAAEGHITQALQDAPEFAPGRINLAMLHLARGEVDEAEVELRQAERLDPDFHQLPQAWAQFYLANQNTREAERWAARAVDRNPNDLQARLSAARVFRVAGDYIQMRRQAHAIMDLTPSAQEAEMRMLLERMLGPTALEPVEEEEAEGDLEGGDLDYELGGGVGDLTLDSPLLGGDGDGPSLGGGSGPSLLGDDVELGGPGGGLGGPGGGGLQLGGGGGGLQLGGGGGGGLRLNLSD